MREMHHNEAHPVNCDGGRSSMKVQNQVRVWPVGQRTSSWHITDMWDRSVSKPISIDGKMANPPFLERDQEREHTDGLARRLRYIRAWLIDIIITCWAAIFHPSPKQMCTLSKIKKNKSTEAPPCGSSSSTTRTTKPCAWLFASS